METIIIDFNESNQETKMNKNEGIAINGFKNTESINDWRQWCRLCAKHDPIGNVSVFFKDEQACSSSNIHTAGGSWTSSSSGNNYFGLATAIGKYFWVNITRDEALPKMICTECYTLITSLVNFSERVTKVQNMFCILQASSNDKKVDLHEMRLKFGLLDEEREHVLQSDRQQLQLPQKAQETEQLMPEVHYFDSKPKVDDLDEQPFEEFNTVANGYKSNPLANLTTTATKAKLHIKKENYNEMDQMQRMAVLENSGEAEEEVQAAHITACEDLQDPFVVDYTDKNGETEDGTSSGYDNDDDNDKIIALLKQQRSSKRRKTKSSTEATTKLTDNQVSTNSIYRCTDCPRKFKRVNHFQMHMKRTHRKDAKMPPTLQCQQCQRQFRTDKQLERHTLVHLPADQKKKLPCPFCEKKFANNTLVQTHIKHIHMNERPFICEECGVTVRTNAALKTHMLTHTDYAPFECEVCKKGFKNQMRLRNHMETHDPNKHICAECGLQLNSRATLNRHLLVHSDEMQHKCDYCGRAFKRAKALKNHLILHTGLKPYSCDFCERTFANGSNCRSHKKKSHPEELAALEAAGGGRTYTRNIPKLEALKAVTKNSDNLAPVVSKQSGCFAFGKKPKPISKTASACSSKSAKDETISTSTTVVNDTVTTSGTDVTLLSNQITSNTSIPTIDNIYNHIMKQATLSTANETTPTSSPVEITIHIKRPDSQNSVCLPLNEQQQDLSMDANATVDVPMPHLQQHQLQQLTTSNIFYSQIVNKQQQAILQQQQQQQMQQHALLADQQSHEEIAAMRSPESQTSNMTATIDDHSNASSAHFYNQIRQNMQGSYI